jgi:hypothetical protein
MALYGRVDYWVCDRGMGVSKGSGQSLWCTNYSVSFWQDERYRSSPKS